MTAESSGRRHPHLPFDADLIAEFLRGRSVVSAELLPLGKTNTNYKLALDDGLVCVLRLRSRGTTEREACMMKLAGALVPVPRELHRGGTWSVFEFLEGQPLLQVPQHTAAAAEALARIGSMRFDSCGWINADGSVEPFAFEGGDFMTERLARPDVQQWISPEMGDAIRDLLRRESGRLREMNADCRLVHGDFNPTNVLVRNGAVTGVLDWEYSHANTRYMDIGNLMRNTEPAYHPMIEAGLRAGGMRLPADWRLNAELIDLSSHVEFLSSGVSDSFKAGRVELIRRCLAAFGA